MGVALNEGKISTSYTNDVKRLKILIDFPEAAFKSFYFIAQHVPINYTAYVSQYTMLKRKKRTGKRHR